MSKVKCPVCGGAMIRYGKNRSGSQRWRCRSCKATKTNRIDNTAKLLNQFLNWLFSRQRQRDLPGCGRTFRRKCARFWKIWPLAPVTGEIHRVIFVDGIYLARNVVVLIASTDRFVVGWYIARSENARSWGALISKIAPPEIVVTDGGTGFEKARRKTWPKTKVQRCVFRAFCQVKRMTTTRPKLEAGVELYGLAKELLHIKTLKEADTWLKAYRSWCEAWNGFLEEKTCYDDGRWDYTHERLRSARGSLNRLISKDVLFTYLDPDLVREGTIPATNNRIEGGVNAQLRAMLRDHRGLSLMRRAKAVFWWCYAHSESPLSASEILKTMPTDKDIEELYQAQIYNPLKSEGPQEWGDGLVWAELRHALPWRIEWD